MEPEARRALSRSRPMRGCLEAEESRSSIFCWLAFCRACACTGLSACAQDLGFRVQWFRVQGLVLSDPRTLDDVVWGTGRRVFHACVPACLSSTVKWVFMLCF